ncbi:MAG TPA: hypothetical protein VK723_00075, partial [Thermoplasmata archaeon]|nr:hypothetical protein [Thermoplasmata archaeon]
EVWSYVGGQKRLDRRYKDKKVWLPRNYFQMAFKERNWEPDALDRVFIREGLAPKVEEKPISIAPQVAVARPRQRIKRA